MNTAMRTAVFCSLLLIIGPAIGCGGDDDTSGVRDVPTVRGDDDAETTENNDTPVPEAEPVVGLVVVRFEPSEAVYGTGDEITPVARVFDIYNRPIEGAEVTWTSEPDGAAMPDGESFTLMNTGKTTFRACSVLVSEAGEPVCGGAAVVVDDAAPVIEILSPMPGAELDAEANPTIEVTGRVTDDSGTPTVFVNNQLVEVDDQGNFSASVDPYFGVNHIDIVATDARTSRERRTGLDVMWAAGYAPLDDNMGAERASLTLTEGIVLRLGQAFFDDDRNPVFTPEGAVFTEDLADVVTLLMRLLDVDTLLPSPVVDQAPTIVLNMSNASLGDAEIDLEVVDGGLELFLRTANMSIDTTGNLSFEGTDLDLDGTLNAGASVVARIDLTKASGDESFAADITTIEIALEQVDGQFTDAGVSAVFALASGFLRSTLEEEIVGALRDSIVSSIPQILEDALNSLEQGLIGQSFSIDLPELGVGTLDIEFAGGIDRVDYIDRTAIELPIRTTLSTLKVPTNASRGVALRSVSADGSPQRAEFFDSSRAQIAVRLALLNSLLHEFWSVGTLDVDATMLLPESVSVLLSSAQLTAKLPPVIEVPRQGEDQDLTLRIGQVELTAEFSNGQVVTYGMNLGAGISLGVMGNELAVEIGMDPEIDIWVIDVNRGQPRLQPIQVENLLRNLVWPELTAALDEGLTLPLPVLDLGDLSGVVPELSTFTLEFDQVRDLVPRGDFLLLDARLRGTLPAQ